MPAAHPTPTPRDPQGSREHTQPLHHTAGDSLMSLIPNSTCSAILLGAKCLSLCLGSALSI